MSSPVDVPLWIRTSQLTLKPVLVIATGPSFAKMVDDYQAHVQAKGAKLAVEVTEYLLPNGDRVRISELSYDGDSEGGETTGKGDFYYVVFPDGVSHEVVTVDPGP